MSATDPTLCAQDASPTGGDAVNVILAGFMGTGKSAIGRRLAQRLGWTFIDTDQLIERQAGMSISRIFAQQGEASFRQIETQVAQGLVDLHQHVVATGGGLVLREENLRACEAAGLVILLEASAETIWQRVRRSSHRPLLQKPDPQGEIQRLLAQRAPAYGRVPYRVVTDGLAPDQVVERILVLMEQRPGTKV